MIHPAGVALAAANLAAVVAVHHGAIRVAAAMIVVAHRVVVIAEGVVVATSQDISIDWDHTVWNHSTQAPYPGVHEAFDRFREAGHRIWIFSCNNPGWIAEMCEMHNLRPHGIWNGHGKMVAAIYVDDRAHRYVDWSEGQVDEILARVERRPVRSNG
jgi:hypothetical protein